MSTGNADDWTMPEVVRNLGGLTKALDRLNELIDDLRDEFVLKEVYERDLAAMRAERDHARAWFQSVLPAFVGAIVGAIATWAVHH